MIFKQKKEKSFFFSLFFQIDKACKKKICTNPYSLKKYWSLFVINDEKEKQSLNGMPYKNVSTAHKRHKVAHACLYCKRSHMTCDEGRQK